MSSARGLRVVQSQWHPQAGSAGAGQGAVGAAPGQNSLQKWFNITLGLVNAPSGCLEGKGCSRSWSAGGDEPSPPSPACRGRPHPQSSASALHIGLMPRLLGRGATRRNIHQPQRQTHCSTHAAVSSPWGVSSVPPQVRCPSQRGEEHSSGLAPHLPAHWVSPALHPSSG